MFGLGKSRTNLGKFIDKHKVTQESLRKSAALSNKTMSDLCGTDGCEPHPKTKIGIVGALRRMGHDVEIGDFWDE